MKRLLAFILLLSALLSLAVPIQAEEPDGQAQKLSTKKCITHAEGFKGDYYYIHDGDLTAARNSESAASITLKNKDGLGYLYFIYQKPYQAGYTVTDNDTGKTITAGLNGFLHEVIDLKAQFGAVPTSVTVNYDNGKVAICELMVYTPGDLPDTVQQWKTPAEGEADLLLFSTHGDDEQLFFAGILPYYAKVKGYNVQVVYLTDHRNVTGVRTHEMLNGLWAVGCDIYPVFGDFPDFLEETGTVEGNKKATYDKFRKEYNITKDDVLAFCTENIRRFKPKVIVTHDFNGEYMHGQHIVYAECVAEALELAADPAQLTASAETYGAWDTPKAYFHLYGENQIVMDWDTPMEELDGMSPFQVTQQLGYPCHNSQQGTWFTGWINGKNGNVITRADQIATHNPCEYGLYRTTVGPDVAKNDFFENVTTHAQDYELWLQQQPAETTPPETTPQETAPQSTAQASDEPDAQTNSRSKSDQILLTCWLVFLSLLVVVLIILLILRSKKM